MKTIGYLSHRSSLIEIFPSGEVPLTSLIVLRGQNNHPDGYTLDATKITKPQWGALIGRLTAKGLSKSQALAAINRGLWLDLSHFCGAETDDPKQIALMLEYGRECDD